MSIASGVVRAAKCRLGMHIWGSWSLPRDTQCDIQRTCSFCSQIQQRDSHDWGTWSREGEEGCKGHRACKRCGGREPGVFHDAGVWTLHWETDTDGGPGIAVNTWDTKECSRCGAELECVRDAVTLGQYRDWIKWAEPQAPSPERHRFPE